MRSTTAQPEVLRSGELLRSRAVVAGSCAAVLGASYAYAPYVHDGPVLCVLRGVTGMPCPSCGLTRAFCALSHGQLGAAVGYHALSPLLFAAVVATVLVCLYEIVTGRVTGAQRLLFSARAGWVLGALFLVHHLGRMALWVQDERLVSGDLRGSWTYALLSTLGVLPS